MKKPLSLPGRQWRGLYDSDFSLDFFHYNDSLCRACPINTSVEVHKLRTSSVWIFWLWDKENLRLVFVVLKTWPKNIVLQPAMPHAVLAQCQDLHYLHLDPMNGAGKCISSCRIIHMTCDHRVLKNVISRFGDHSRRTTWPRKLPRVLPLCRSLSCPGRRSDAGHGVYGVCERLQHPRSPRVLTFT